MSERERWVRPASQAVIRIPFTKLVGTGNDFVLVDTLQGAPRPGTDLSTRPVAGRKSGSGSRRLSLRRGTFPGLRWPLLAKALCDPRHGEGTDGLLVLGPSRRADVRMRIFNPDGSEAEMCGNGIRCLGWYANWSRAAGRSMTVETGAGVKRVAIQNNGLIRVDMGAPRYVGYVPARMLRAPQVQVAHIMDSGVPHLVCWTEHLEDIDVKRLGRRLRHHPHLPPKGANVDFVELIRVERDVDQKGRLRRERVTLKMRTYERGVEGETKACGTGAVAAAASYAIPGPYCVTNNPYGGESDLRQFEIVVRVSGGVLYVSLSAEHFFKKRGLVLGRAFLNGEAHLVSKGIFKLHGRSPA